MKKHKFTALFVLVFIFSLSICAPLALSRDLKADVKDENPDIQDHGGTPWITDIEEITLENDLFREAKWTGRNIQLTLMSIPPGGEIGGEVHPANDQFIRIESGTGRAMMGKTENDLIIDEEISDDWVLLIPAGYWHNLVNVGDTPLKLYAIYGPPEHPKGTIHETYEEAEASHHDH